MNEINLSEGNLIVLLTTIAGILLQLYRENRARRWQVEDREWSRQQGVKLETKIDENTAISRDAIEHANHVNEKIAHVAEEVRTNVTEPLQTTTAILRDIAERPIVPVAVLRRDDADHIIDLRQHRDGPPGRRKDDPR